MSEVIRMKTRFEFGKKRTVLNPGDVIDLPDKKYGLKEGDIKRLIDRKAGVVMPKADLNKTSDKKEG